MSRPARSSPRWQPHAPQVEKQSENLSVSLASSGSAQARALQPEEGGPGPSKRARETSPSAEGQASGSRAREGSPTVSGGGGDGGRGHEAREALVRLGRCVAGDIERRPDGGLTEERGHFEGVPQAAADRASPLVFAFEEDHGSLGLLEGILLGSEVKVRDVRAILSAVNQPLFTKLNGFPVVKELSVGGVTLRVYQGTILFQNLTALLRTKRFYTKDAVTGRLERTDLYDIDSPRVYGNLHGFNFALGTVSKRKQPSPLRQESERGVTQDENTTTDCSCSC